MDDDVGVPHLWKPYDEGSWKTMSREENWHSPLKYTHVEEWNETT